MGESRSNGRKRIDRATLEDLVERETTVARIAEALGTSAQTVNREIARLGLPRPIDIRREVVDRALREGVTTLTRKCRRHGETDFAIVGSERRLRCKRCRSEAVARRRRRVKEQLVAEAGGRCELCGFDGCLPALEFHHRDPSKKAFGIAMRGITRSIDAVREEAAKCVLLCSNCHAAVEAGLAKVPLQS